MTKHTLTRSVFEGKDWGMRWLLALSVGASLLIGCKQKQKEPEVLSGQIFVVLNNRDTIKLSLVPVSLVHSNSAASAVLELQGLEKKKIDLQGKLAVATNKFFTACDQLEYLENSIGSLERQIGKDQSVYDETVTSAREEANDLYRSRGITDRNKAEIRQTVASINSTLLKFRSAIADMKERLKKTEDAAGDKRVEVGNLKTATLAIAAEIDELKTRRLVWNSLANRAIASVTTDADGKFQLSVTNKNISIVAYATRKTLSVKDEEYFWIVNVPTDRKQIVLLNNANQIE